MAEVSFVHVPTEGFAGFDSELSSGAWGSIDVSSYVGADGRAAQPLGNAPLFVVLKLQLLWPIADVLRAMSGAGMAKSCDNAWDGTQKLLSSLLVVGLASKDPEKRAAAGRMQKLLVLGDGEKQTQLKYQQEVDFGRQQVRLMSANDHLADVALLGLQSVVVDIAATTNALAHAIGYGVTGLSPAKHKRATTAACVQAFGAVAEQLAWLSEFGLDGADRQKAIALREALVELATRYPRPNAGKANMTQSAATSAPPVG